MNADITTWADGFGVWHAEVKDASYSTARRHAARAITEELAERGSLFDGKLVVVRSHGNTHEFKEAGE